MLTLRRELLPLGNQWYDGVADAAPGAGGLHDLAWLDSDGSTMVDNDWGNTEQRVLGCLIGRPGKATAPMLMLFNTGTVDATFTLPEGAWRALLDSSSPRGDTAWSGIRGSACTVGGRSLILLMRGDAAGATA